MFSQLSNQRALFASLYQVFPAGQFSFIASTFHGGAQLLIIIQTFFVCGVQTRDISLTISQTLALQIFCSFGVAHLTKSLFNSLFIVTEPTGIIANFGGNIELTVTHIIHSTAAGITVFAKSFLDSGFAVFSQELGPSFRGGITKRFLENILIAGFETEFG
ncbi:MAG: hypothetical protein BWY75_02683 [bacterium ADurb.Bin425]|nr:MAG: hypothetical protein BWY75_02683 [bacterium ADurb.Bin425]